jgi:hypothetical protein
VAPSFPEIVLGIVATVAGCLGAAISIRVAIRSGNWFGYVCGLGCTAFVAGIIGQRTFPTPDAVARLGATAAQTSAPGPWDAGVGLPIVGVHLTPVAVAGLLVAAAGLSMLLLFERIPEGPPRVRPALRPLDDDDTV